MYVIEGANLFCGDDPNDTKHLTLASIQLPMLEETFAEHKPGGAQGNIDIHVGMEKFELPFKLNGFDPQVLQLFMPHAGKIRTNYTLYKSVQDQKSGRSIELKALIEGRLGEAKSEEYQSGELTGTNYAIKGISHYELSFDGNELLYWDFYTSALRVNGVDKNSERNRILRIGG
jgi:P2 family phage contractile tail tube protein